jgi:hypothetical protein
LVPPITLVVPTTLGVFLASVGTREPQKCAIRHPTTRDFIAVTPLAMQTRPSAGLWMCVEWYETVMLGVRRHKTMWVVVPDTCSRNRVQEDGADDPAFATLLETDTPRV